MKNAWAIREITDEVIKISKQLGVSNIIHYGGPGQIDYDQSAKNFKEYKNTVEILKSHNLNLVGIEGGFLGNPQYWDIATGGPTRDEKIEELMGQIRDMARAGVPVFGYHWMPLGPLRSEPTKIRGSAHATAFNQLSQNISIAGNLELVRQQQFKEFTESDFPGMDQLENLTTELMWENLEYWIKAITPVAEEEGIRLGIHPDDPPVKEIGGVPRILNSFVAYKKLMDIYPSDHNAIEFCQGTFSEMEGEDIYEMIKYFAERNKILYVHFRNVSSPTPGDFHEEFINTGYVDMYKAMKTYRDAGYKGCFMDDHCPDIEGDKEFPGNLGGYRSRIFAQGYIQALLQVLKN